MTSLPRQPADVTAAWLSEVLGAEVATVSATTIAEGAGFMGRLARLELTYAPGATGPSTMVAKLPTDEPGGVALGQMLRLWEREARFYTDVAALLPVRTAACYWAGGDAESGIFGLLLEDLTGYVGGEQVAGASLAQAEQAIDWLARFHAAGPAGGGLAAPAWMPDTSDDPMYQALQPLLEALWPTFVDQFSPQAPAAVRGWVEKLIPRFSEAMAERLLDPTIVHADFRVDNLFFDGPDVITLDWQAVALGQGLYDVAYFLGGSLPVDLRRDVERRLVERYRLGLAAAGVAVPGPDELFESYRRTMLYTLGVVALLMGQLDFTVNERAGDLARTIVDRFYTAGADLGLGDVAGG